MALEPLFPESANVQLRPVGGPPDVGFIEDPRLTLIQKRIAAREPKISGWRKTAIECYRFRDGKQLSDEDERQLQNQGRPTTAFNHVQKFINYVGGVQRECPLTVLFNAIDLDDTQAQLYGEAVGKRYDWARRQTRADIEGSRVFEDVLTCGMGWERGAIGTAQDPRGLVILPRLNPLEMLWDDCDKINLGGVCSDGMSRWRAHESWVDIDEAKTMFSTPYARFLLDSAGIEGTGTIRNWPSVDRAVYIIPYVQTYPLDSQVTGIKGQKKDRCRIMEFQWWDIVQGMVFIDPLDQSEQWMRMPEFHEYEKQLRSMKMPEIKDSAKQDGREFKKAFLLNRRHFLQEPEPIFGMSQFDENEGPPRRSQRFSFNCMCLHFDEESRMWYAFMRVLMDPQRWANKFFNQTIELYGRQAKGGALAEDGAFEDKAQMTEFVNTYAQPGKVNIVGDINRIKEKELPETPTAALTILQFIQQSMPAITGIAPDAMGTGASSAVAQTVRRRQRAGMVLLAAEFDAEAMFRKDEALIVFDLLQEISDDRLIRVGGHFDSGEVISLDNSPYSLEYEIEIDDVERDPNMREWLADLIMGQWGQTAMRMGKWLPEFYNVLPIPRRWIEKYKQMDAQQAQQAQQFAALGLPPLGGRGAKKSIPMQLAETDNKKADTQLKLAKAKKEGSQGQGDTLRTILDMLTAHQDMQHTRAKHGMELQAKKADLMAGMMKAQTDVAKAQAMSQIPQQPGMQNGNDQYGGPG